MAARSEILAGPVAPERLQREFKQLPIPDRHTYVTGFKHGQTAFEVAQAWHTFAHAINEGHESHPGFEDVIKIHYVLDAAERSVKTGSWQKVDYSGLGKVQRRAARA